MKNISWILVFSAALGLAACGSSDQSGQKTATQAPPSGTINISKSNVFSPMVQDLNKAKQVNNTVQQQFQQANGQVEAPTAATTSGP